MSVGEQPLFGGLVNGRVVRVGDTVRRPAGPWTPTIQALLAHLNGKGFPAPKPLGIDALGREVVSFIPGAASTHPWPSALLRTTGAQQVGDLVRRYHTAVRDFAPPPSASWAHRPQALRPEEVVVHGDFGPHNLIWRDDRLVGLIDFELCRPGLPEEDAVFALLRVAHLRPDNLAARVGFEAPPDRRARLIAFSQGVEIAPDRLLASCIPVQAAELDRIERLGGAGVEPWGTFLRRGLAEEARLELAWLQANLGDLA